jgi:hypothetical protein
MSFRGTRFVIIAVVHVVGVCLPLPGDLHGVAMRW